MSRKDKIAAGMNTVSEPVGFGLYQPFEVKQPRVWHANELSLFKRITVNDQHVAVCGIPKANTNGMLMPEYPEWVLCYEAGNTHIGTGAFVEVIDQRGERFTTKQVQAFHELSNAIPKIA